jgi:hypothetical protein
MTHYFIAECSNTKDMRIPCALIFLSSTHTSDSITILARGDDWDAMLNTESYAFNMTSQWLHRHGIEGEFQIKASYEIEYEDFKEEKERMDWRALRR